MESQGPWWASMEGCSSNTNSVQKRWNQVQKSIYQLAWIYGMQGLKEFEPPWLYRIKPSL